MAGRAHQTALVLLVILMGVSTGCQSYSYHQASLRIPPYRSIPLDPPASTFGPQFQEAVTMVQKPIQSQDTDARYTLLGTASVGTAPADFSLDQIIVMVFPSAAGSPEAPESLLERLCAVAEACFADVAVIFSPTEQVRNAIVGQGLPGVALASGDIVLTPLPIARIEDHSVIIYTAPDKEMAVTAANLENQGSVLGMLAQSPQLSNWTAHVETQAGARQAVIEPILQESGSLTTVLAVSAGEPSDLDWKNPSDTSYRTDYAWPLAPLIRSAGFDDSYDATRHDPETDPGITAKLTLGTTTIGERTDFLYARNLFPMDTWTVALEFLSETEPAIERSAVAGTFLIP